MKSLFAALALLVAMTTVAAAQGQAQVRVRGTVVSLEGNVLTVSTAGGPSKVTLDPNFRVQYLVKSDLAHVVPGSFVGCAATQLPDGTLRAIEVHIFPPGFSPGAGSRPYDLGPNSVMTNGNIETVADAQVGTVGAHSVVIKYPDGQKTVVVTPATVIVSYAKADASALTPGSHVIVTAVKQPDGSLTAAGVNVGKDGLVPPM